jgi:hypothetical protein
MGVSAPTGPALPLPPGLPTGSGRPGSGSVKNRSLSAANAAMSAGALKSGKIAVSGQAGSQAPQSMHSRGLMYSLRSPS